MEVHEQQNLSGEPSKASGSGTTSEPFDVKDQAERLRIISKLFSLYPKQQDAEMRLEALRESTSDIPSTWISHACKRLTEEPYRKWCPVVNEIRQQAARSFREWRRKMSGQRKLQYNAHVQGDPLDVERELKLARGLEPLVPLITPGGREPRRRRQ